MVYSGFRHHYVITSLLAASLLFPTTVFPNDLIFTSPPRENNNAQAENIYEPVAEYLSDLLGKKVVYHNPGNWLRYQKEMREGKYDIVFDGPHFIDWRVGHLEHQVVARLPGTMEFVVVAKADDNSINVVEDLVGKTVCTLPPPNLGTLSVLDKFRNPVRQPIIKAIKGESPNVFEAFKAGTCQTATLRSTFYNKRLTDEDRKRMKIIAKMISPNQGISVSKRLDPHERQLIAQKFTRDDSAQAIRKLVEIYGQKDDKRFVVTENSEYRGQSQKLEGVVYGW